jgi:lipid A 3-O-deacylase
LTSALRSAAFAALVAGILPAAAAAQAPAPPPPAPLPAAAPPPPAPAPLIDEMKVGLLAHDVGFLGHHVEGGADVNFEMLFTPPDIFRAIGSPRPTIGGEVNTAGNTDNAYFGLTWGITLIQNLFGWGGSIFANGTLGGAVQDGFTNHAPPGRKTLGSPVLFHLGAELGYQVTPTVSVSAFLDHMSNANLAPHNAGITNAGARLGFKF